MTAFTIRQYGDPVLRQVGEPVKEFGKTLRLLGEAMLVTMHEARGIGLAAPQIGLSLQLFVVHVNDEDHAPILDGKVVKTAEIMPLIIANATVKILPGDSEPYTEGCLSFPKITGEVSRVEAVMLDYRDADGAPHTLECRGLLARCIQHEHDHCQGVLFIDRMAKADQLATNAKVKKLKRLTLAALKANSKNS